MTQQQQQTLLDLAESKGVEAGPYDGYSGRGMFGRTTYGVTTPPRYVDGLTVAFIRSEGLQDGFRFKQDDLGLDVILY
jgi:hypothetical protein